VSPVRLRADRFGREAPKRAGLGEWRFSKQESRVTKIFGCGIVLMALLLSAVVVSDVRGQWPPGVAIERSVTLAGPVVFASQATGIVDVERAAEQAPEQVWAYSRVEALPVADVDPRIAMLPRQELKRWRAWNRD
jgi:hypothetical protein